MQTVKKKTAKQILNEQEERIVVLVREGKSVNEIMRLLKITADHAVRKWIKTHRPDLQPQLEINGRARYAHAKGRIVPKEC